MREQKSIGINIIFRGEPEIANISTRKCIDFTPMRYNLRMLAFPVLNSM